MPLQARAGAVFEIREDVVQDNAAYKFQFDQLQVRGRRQARLT